MAIANADITRYDSGSASDQEARVRRDERIRLFAERDRIMRELQQLRGVAAMEMRDVQTLNRKDAGGNAAQSQAAVVGLERRLQQLEQDIAATGDTEPELTPQTEGEAGIQASDPSVSTADVRRPQGTRQLAGSASGRTSTGATPGKEVGRPPGNARLFAGAAAGVTGDAVIAGRRPTASGASSSLLRGYATGKWQVLKDARVQHRADKQRDHRIAKARAGALKPPRKLFYFPLVYLAVVADVLGIVAQFVNLTGVGAFLVSAVSFLLGVFFLIVSILIGRKIKKSRNIGNEIGARVTQLERQTKLLRQGTAFAVRLARRTAKGRSFLRTGFMRKGFVKLAKWTKAITKWCRWLQVVLEAIPFLNLFPWYTINMVLVYRERKSEYKEAMAVVAQYPAADNEEEAAFADFHEAKAAEIDQTLQQAEEEDEEDEQEAFGYQQPQPAIASVSMRDVGAAA